MATMATTKPGKYFYVYAWTIVNGQPELMNGKLLFSEHEAIQTAKHFIKVFGFHVWVKEGNNVIFEQ